MDDVAREAGVSQTTVSFVLNGIEAGLPESTKQRVLEAARRLNYTPNDAARRLASNRSRAIGLAIYDIRYVMDYQQAAASVLSSVFRAAEIRGQRLGVYTTHERAESGEDIETYFATPVLGREVDGVVVWDYYVGADRLISSFKDGLPIVLLDRQTQDVPCVVPDYDQGLIDIVRHLVSSGRKSLRALVRPGEAYRDTRFRAAFDTAARLAGLAPNQFACLEQPGSRRSGDDSAIQEIVDQLLEMPEPPDAIICARDHMALSVLTHLRARGVDVPGSIAVVGCAGLPVTSHPAFRLSTLDLRLEVMGIHAVDLVVRMAKGEQLSGTCIVVRPEFIPRQTS